MLDLSEHEAVEGANPRLFGTRNREMMFVGGLTKSDLLAPTDFGSARHRR